MDDVQFVGLVWEHYHAYGRDLPWRHAELDGTYDPYKIMVSEIMLQQTQALRVIPKYQQFIRLFPTIEQLAAAPLADVLRVWNGLGYNRRAKFLWQAAQAVVMEHGGVLPSDQAALTKLPGIGTNTAAAIAAYAYDQPTVFIETNIRTVFIYHFFAEQEQVTDQQILEIVARTLSGKQVFRQPGTMAKPQNRQWYWALMDYGVHLKSTVGNASRQSRGYAKQSTFTGSLRQIRGQVIRHLTDGPQSLRDLQQVITDDRLGTVLDDLLAEQLVQKTKGTYHL